MLISKYKKIMIVGNNGSGKSYLAREIADATGLPLIHLDLLYWKPGWRSPSRMEWVDIQKQHVCKAAWIIEGNHTDTMELRFKEAELIIFLDFNRLNCLLCVIKRLFEKRLGSPTYLDYKFDKSFLKLLLGVWQFPQKRRPIILNLKNKYNTKHFISLNNRKQVNNLITKLKKEAVEWKVK